MKRVSNFALLLALPLALCAAAPAGARGQAGVRPRTAQGTEKGQDGKDSADAVKVSEAQALYEEASQYAQRKFEEFRQKQMPYDPLLEQKTLQEQKDLALQHAARLAARAPLRGTDLYYSGLLYSLAGKGEGALDSMRKFLADAEPGHPDLKQRARSVTAQQAAQLGLLEEAEGALADYAKSEPRNVSDLHRMNLLVASAYVKKKDYARAAAPAAEAYRAALEYARTARDPEQRDTTIFGAGSFYANLLVKAGRRAEGVRVAQEMRARAFALPSARLYGQATELVLRQGEPFGPPPEVAGLEPPASPELAVAELIGQGPVRLSELRGKVVLIDFWATWCTYCVKTMPRLNALHQKYKDRGLVVIGLNEFEGNIQGRPATRAQELEYFRQFKRRMNVSYDFAVAADARNDGPYGVAGLPTAVLVDRRGRVRFLTIGASEEEAELLKTTILKLLDEKE
ncbi:MAG TPA: TlpA disulfide reductase family protein [Pyrinomonadaceae bacterium]|jgi:thiol-disulfide isomerase/thioredoxin